MQSPASVLVQPELDAVAVGEALGEAELVGVAELAAAVADGVALAGVGEVDGVGAGLNVINGATSHFLLGGYGSGAHAASVRIATSTKGARFMTDDHNSGRCRHGRASRSIHVHRGHSEERR